MTDAWPRRALSLLVTLAALIMVGAEATAATAPVPASGRVLAPMGVGVEAATATSRVTVVPTSISPTILTRRAPISIAGIVTAALDAPLSGSIVRVVTDPMVFEQRSEVTTWAGSTRPGRGRVVAETALPAIRAGEAVSFSVTIPTGRIFSHKAFAALPLSVEVAPRGVRTPTAVTHTFIAWNSRKEFEPIRVATVLPVALGPDGDLYSRDAATRSAAWTEQLGDGSRLNRIIEGTKGTAATLAIDPSLFSPPGPDEGQPTPSGTATGTQPSAAPSATASTSSQAPSTTSPSTDQPGPAPDSAIAPLVRTLRGELRGRSLWALPYADADLAAAADVDPANGLIRSLVNRADELASALDTSTRPTVVWPVDGVFSAAREKALRTLMAGTSQKRLGPVIVSQAAVTADSAYTPSALRVSPSGTRVLAFDNGLSALLPRSDASAALATQQFLAESLVLLGERPGTSRSILLAAPREYDPDPGGLSTFLHSMDDAAWLTPVNPQALLNGPETRAPLAVQRPTTAPKAIAPRPVLTASRLAALTAQRDTILQVATVLRDGASFEATYRELLGQLTSARWRLAPSSWQKLSNSVITDTKAATSAIKVIPQGVNFLAAHGILRITVVNGLDYTVDGVRLVVKPTNPRMTVEQPGPITIGPGAKTTVRVPATALAAGRVDIQAYLTTPDGTPIGQPAIMQVSANPLDSTFYWTGAILVGLVLLFGVARTIRKGTSRVDEIGGLETVAAEVERREQAEHS